MKYINKKSDFINFLSVVIVSAPDKFLQFDFIAKGGQMNLARAFYELNEGLRFFKDLNGNGIMLSSVQQLLDKSLRAYRNGDKIEGAHLLQDLEGILFPYD